MFAMDVPYVPPEENTVILAQAAVTQGQVHRPNYLMKACDQIGTEEDSKSATNYINPAGSIWIYMMRLRKKELDFSDFKPVLLKGPQHGVLEYKETVSSGPYNGYRKQIRRGYLYTPEPGFVGNDSATFLVEFEGKYYQVEQEIQVVKGFQWPAEDMDKVCHDSLKLIKLSRSGAKGL